MIENPLRQKFLWALLIFAGLCQSFAMAHIGSIKVENQNERTWTAWAVEDFVQPKRLAPQVVFLGSSLMLTPLNMADAQILDKTLDGAKYHQSAYFNQLIKQCSGRTIENFNFALPGEMPSDAYLITKKLLCENKKPQMIIYGVGPRDFMDNLLDNPTATDPYRYLLKNSGEKPDKLFLDNRWDQQLDSYLNNLIYLYGKKENLASRCELAYQNLLDQKFLDKLPLEKLDSAQKHSLCPNYHSMTIALGEGLFKPIAELGNQKFTDNLDEYRKRYGTLNWNTFLTQVQFLSKLLDLSHKQNIEVVVVAMPITTTNRQLIPAPTWDVYKGSLKKIAYAQGAKFIDLGESGRFNDNDFGDTVHLNTVGGIKLLQLLAVDLTRSGKLQAVNQMAAKGSVL